MWNPSKLTRAGRLADGLLMFALAGLTFLLGCQELFDADVWWHLRAGRWILEHRAVPWVDPFTFGSAGQPWVDVHWLFQVGLTLAFGAFGVAGTILLAAAGASGAVVAGFGLRHREWPAWIVAAAWLPGVLLASTRFDPRPEIVTLVCLSAFFGILLRARQAPGWLWVLVPIEVLWVNTHGLFVLGPWMLVLFLIDRAIVGGEPPWRRLWMPSLAVGLACLANPYGLRGVLLPLELFPKLTEAGGAYKAYIGEFMSPRRMVETYWRPVPGHDLYLRLFVFLLAALPLAVLVPSVWRAAKAGGRAGDEGPAWAGGMALGLGLALAVALGLPGPTAPVFWTTLGRAAPWLMAGAGGAAAVALWRRSPSAALLALAGAGAAGGWSAWLVGHLFDNEPHLGAGLLALGLGIPAAWLAIRAGSRPFGPLLAASFAVLGLMAVRNMSLFGLVSGAVLAAELGEWAAERSRGRVTAASASAAGIAARCAVLGGVGVLCGAVVTGRFFAHAEDCHRFGLRERPFYYAHEACRFASRPGLPDRALVFGLNQASVYEFHNSPAHRVYIDGRLEVASRATFENYVQLHERLTQGDPRWTNAVRRLGDPLIVVDHEDNLAAEATLLADPRWRCIYLDAVAAVFLARDGDRERERAYPTFDFGARHFHRPAGREGPSDPAAAHAEAWALVRVGAVLAHRPVARWSLQIPIDLVAMDRARAAIADAPGVATAWMVLGHAALGLTAEPSPPTIGATAPWNSAVDLPWAQAVSAYRAALVRGPDDESVLRPLAAFFALRGMDDARRAVEARLNGTSKDTDTGLTLPAPTIWPGPGEARFARAIDSLLQQGRPLAAVAVAAEARRRGQVLSWAIADRVAAAYLHLGEPVEARRTWLEAANPPSPALRAARVADADLAAWDLDGAEAGYRRALTLDHDLAEAWVGLALTALERGRAGEALEAGRTALRLMTATEPRRRTLLEGIVALSATYARAAGDGP